MKTRFDYSGVWITGVGEAVPVGNMETPHLLNTVRMLIQKPARTLSILVADIEHATFSDTVWTPFNADDRKQSLKNVTSLTTIFGRTSKPRTAKNSVRNTRICPRCST